MFTLPEALRAIVRYNREALFAMLYLLSVALHYAWLEMEASRRAEVLAREAQLRALKAQVNPHFLFNTLHSIAELVHDNPARAETMIVRLSDFLRLTLDHVGTPEVPLSEELDFLRRYLEIEQMRFEDRLQVVWEIDDSLLSVRVPNLILQPIVENALKHGFSRNTAHGLLRISCLREEEKLAMKVFDSGPGPVRAVVKIAEPVREGVGLNNTRSRLERLYGGDHLISFRRPNEGGFEVAIRIPMRPLPAAA